MVKDKKESKAEDIYENIFVEPVPDFFKKFLEFVKNNFLTMDLKSYQEFVLNLYRKYSKRDMVDFILADIYASCVGISHLNPAHRKDEIIKKENDSLSIRQKVWLDVVLKRIK